MSACFGASPRLFKTTGAALATALCDFGLSLRLRGEADAVNGAALLQQRQAMGYFLFNAAVIL